MYGPSAGTKIVVIEGPLAEFRLLLDDMLLSNIESYIMMSKNTGKRINKPNARIFLCKWQINILSVSCRISYFVSFLYFPF